MSNNQDNGNAAAMREACVNIVEYARSARCHTDDAHVLGFLDQIERWAQAALFEPPRNCDVGTAEEQAWRFREFCGCRCLTKCKVFEKGIALGIVNESNYYKANCRFIWAQMPYKAQKGGAYGVQSTP